ncbi:MAG: rod shape-determining protein MreD [Bacteroidetes bacterium]|nr:rod shape-determining protein MreD [Bacteroidota bacterium]
MRRKRNQLILAIVVSGIVLHVVQIAFVDNFMAIGTASPDLLLILTAFVGMRLGQFSGSLTGFSAGLLQDAGIHFFGLLALSKTWVGFLARYFHAEKILLAEKFYFPLVVFVLSIVHDTIRYIIQTLNSNVAFTTLLWERGVADASYSAVVALLIWWVTPDSWIDFVKFNKRFDR